MDFLDSITNEQNKENSQNYFSTQNNEIITNVAQSGLNDVKQASALDIFDKMAQADTKDVVNAALNSRQLERIKNDEKVSAKMDKVADTIIDTHLETQTVEATNKLQEAKMKRGKFARRVFGLSDDLLPWQQKIVDIGSAFWFCVYTIIAFLTIVPVGVFSEGLTKVFKKGWIAIVLAVTIYLAIIFVPVILSLVG